MLNLLLALFLAAPTAPPPDYFTLEEIPLASIVGGAVVDVLPIGAPDGSLDLFLILKGGRMILADVSAWTIEGTVLRIVRPDFGPGEDPFDPYDLFEDQPNEFQTAYMDIQGNVHTINTDCAKYIDIKRCVTTHGAAVAAFQALFKPAPLGLKPPGGEGEDTIH